MSTYTYTHVPFNDNTCRFIRQILVNISVASTINFVNSGRLIDYTSMCGSDMTFSILLS